VLPKRQSEHDLPRSAWWRSMSRTRTPPTGCSESRPVRRLPPARERPGDVVVGALPEGYHGGIGWQVRVERRV
jgi:hypothetical protein